MADAAALQQAVILDFMIGAAGPPTRDGSGSTTAGSPQ
jgi:hypothetical protein